MARFFFDIHDTGTIQRDEVGAEFDTVEDACREAARFLPDVARDELPKNGDHRSFVVLVTDEARRPIYSATLTFNGLRLQR